MKTRTTETPEVLTPEETAKRLRLGRNAVYAALAKGEIPSIRIGRKILVSRAVIDRMVSGDAKAAG